MECIYFIEMGWEEMDWMDLAQDRDNERLGLVNGVITL
jgi:hypothetical protein